MVRSTQTMNRWSLTHKAAVVLDLPRGEDGRRAGSQTWAQLSPTVCLAGSIPGSWPSRAQDPRGQVERERGGRVRELECKVG